MIPYILHVTIIITCCFIFYKALLQQQTFYRLNRWMLISCLAVAFVLPKLPVPAKWTLLPGLQTRIVAEEKPYKAPANVEKPSTAPAGHLPSTYLPAADPVTAVKPAPTLMRHPAPALKQHSVTTLTQHPAEKTAIVPSEKVVIVPSVTAPVVHAAHPLTLESMLKWVYYAWLSGVAILGASLFFQIFLLLFRAYTRPVMRDGRYRIVEMTGDHAPCSFGNNIYINPSRYDWETYQQILVHEKVHASGWHTLDILLVELCIVVQWFNPFVWLYRREVENNLEFLTDQQVLSNPSIERSTYQLSLLKVSVPNMPLSITSNYNQSLLKRRIIMMNSHRSSIHTIWKYFFLLPLLTLLVCALNEPHLIAQTVTKTTGSSASRPAAAGNSASSASASNAAGSTGSVSASNAAGAANAAGLAVQTTAASLGALQPLSGSLTSTGTGNVTVSTNADVQFTTQASVRSVNGIDVQATVPVTVVVPNVNVASTVSTSDTSRPQVRYNRNEGSWFITGKDDKMWLELKGGDEEHNWSSSSSVDKNEFTGLTSTGNVTFTLKRDAGIITFTGQFDGQQGFGHYSFKADPSYVADVRKSMSVEDEDMFSLFQVNLRREDIAMFKRNFPNIKRNELISMAALHIDEPFITSWKNAGYGDISEHTLITLKALKIDAAYLQDIRKAGYDKLTLDNLITFKSLNIDGAYIRSLNLPSLPPAHELVTYKSLNVTAEYIASLKQAGYSDIPAHDLVTMKSVGIDGSYIRSLKAAGYNDIAVQDLVTCRSVGVDGSFIQGFKTIGYNNIPTHDLITLKSIGVTPDYVRQFRELGYKDIPAQQLVTLKSVGVTADYVHKMRDKGFVSDDLQKYIRLKTAEF